MAHKLDHEPSAEEIAQQLDKPVDDVNRMLRLNERITSVDTPLGGDSEKALLDILADENENGPEDTTQEDDMKQSIVSLQWHAKRRLKQLDLHNISTRHGDGWQGWASRGPFDAIIVTAAAVEIPPALMQQLDEGGVMILPVGDQEQSLQRVQRRQGDLFVDEIESVRFVPLVKGELA